MPPIERLDRDLIVIGGSAGALPVLQQIVAGLPGDLAAAIAVVVHQESRACACMSSA